MLKIAALTFTVLMTSAGIAAACGGPRITLPAPKVADCYFAKSAALNAKPKNGVVAVTAFYADSSVPKYELPRYARTFHVSSHNANIAKRRVKRLSKERKPIVFSFRRFVGSKTWVLSVESVKNRHCPTRY